MAKLAYRQGVARIADGCYVVDGRLLNAVSRLAYHIMEYPTDYRYRRTLKELAYQILEKAQHCEEVAGAANGIPDVRAIVIGALQEMQLEGESYETCARWISERVHAALANNKMDGAE